MRPNKVEVIKEGVLRALGRPATLVMLVLGLAAAAILHSWWLVVAALGGSVVAAAVLMRRVEYWSQVIHELRRRPVELPSEIEICDQVARGFLVQLDRTRRERERALACGVATLSSRTLSLLETAAEAEGQALSLIHARDRLSRFMSRQDGRPARAPIGSDDLDAGWCARMVDERLAAGRDLTALKEHLDVRLAALLDTLAILPPRLATLRMGEDLAVAGAVDREIRERLGTEVRALHAEAVD